MKLFDLRSVPPEQLADQLPALWAAHRPALLTVSRRPHKGWAKGLNLATPLLLSSAPLYELILWLDPAQLPALPEPTQREHAQLLEGYSALFTGAQQADAYRDLVLAHIASQEQVLFPRLLALAPLERLVRELGYEHQGLVNMMCGLAEAVEAHRQGALSKKDKEAWDLGFFHLLEHHLERESLAVYPAWSYLEDRAALEDRSPQQAGFQPTL